MSKEIEKEEIEKPDYSKLYHDESRVLAHKIVELMAIHKEEFIIDSLEKDGEVKKQQEEKLADFALNVLSLLSDSTIPADYATMCIEKISESLVGLSSFIKGTIATHEDEMVSRIYGKKNHEGKFRREFVTVKDILLKLNEVREETGGNKDEFFNA